MDLHIHSNWTEGENSIEEIVQHAESIGITAIAFTDHVRATSDYFFNYVDEIKTRKKETNIILYIGFETRIKNFKGELDVSADFKQDADIMIASVHRFPFAKELFSADLFKIEIAQAIEYELCMCALEQKDFNVLGHAGGMCLKQFGLFPKKYFESIINLCSKTDIAFEINYKYHKNIFTELFSLLKKYNPFVTFGSDAHNIDSIAEWIKKDDLRISNEKKC
jgi:putative hydrolase